LKTEHVLLGELATKVFPESQVSDDSQGSSRLGNYFEENSQILEDFRSKVVQIESIVNQCSSRYSF